MKKLKSRLSHAILKAQVATTMAALSFESYASDPIGAGSYSSNLGNSISSVNNSIALGPTVLLNVAQIFGVFAGWKAWDTWGKAQKGQDPNATPGKSLGWLVGGVGAYFLPSMLGMGGATLLPG